MPADIKRKAKIAIIGEISIMPSGGMNWRKKAKYGSTTFPNIRPNDVSRIEGTHDISI